MHCHKKLFPMCNTFNKIAESKSLVPVLVAPKHCYFSRNTQFPYQDEYNKFIPVNAHMHTHTQHPSALKPHRMLRISQEDAQNKRTHLQCSHACNVFKAHKLYGFRYFLPFCLPFASHLCIGGMDIPYFFSRLSCIPDREGQQTQ